MYQSFQNHYLTYEMFRQLIFVMECNGGEAFLLTARAFVLTVELLCLQSVEVLLRHTFSIVSKEAQL